MLLSWLLLMFFGVFALAAAAVFLANLVLEKKEEARPVVLNIENKKVSDPSFDDEGPALLREQELSTISPLAWLLERVDFAERLNRLILDSDIHWSPGRVTGLMLLCGAVGFAFLGLIRWVPLIAKVGGACFLSMLPVFYLRSKRQKRVNLIQEQFPESLDTIARAMRAGHPFAAALELASSQAPNPLAKELRRTFAEGALGMAWEQALDGLSTRLRIQEVSQFAAAVRIQTRTGGNLSEVLDKLTENMREASAVSGEVRSYSNQGRLAGLILTILPLCIAVIMYFVNPEFLDPLFTETIGNYMLMGAAAGLIVAHFVIKKLVDIRL